MFRSPRPSKSSSRAKLAGIVAAVACVFATFALGAPDARADDAELLTLTCSGGKVSVTAKGVWYVNDKAPWKWDNKKPKSLSAGDHEKHGPDHGKAEFEGTTCEGIVKAFICNGDQCKGPIPVNVH